MAISPFRNSVTNGLVDLAQSLEAEHQVRLGRYRRLWRFYHGQSFDHRHIDTDETLVDLNFARKIADKHVAFLFRQPFKVTIPDDPQTPESETDDRAFVVRALNRAWKANNIMSFCTEMGQMGSVTGDVFVRVSWQDNVVFGKPFPRADVLPSRYVFPYFDGPHGIDRKHMSSCLVVYPRYADDRQSSEYRDQAGPLNTKSIILSAEHWFPDRVLRWDEGASVPREEPNPFGVIPIVHVANFPNVGSFYGQSDIEDALGAIREFNEKMTDVSDVINYHGSPITIVEGARVERLERGANRVWSIPEGSKAYNLALEGDLAASMQYINLLRKAMHELGSVPEDSLGGDTGVQTGAALALRYQVTLERRAVKMAMYGEGLTMVNRLFLKLLELKDDDFYQEFQLLDEANRYETEIVFGPALPRDESIELDNSKKRVEVGVSSRRAEMERMGLSQTQVKRVDDEWFEDKKRIAEIEAKTQRAEQDPTKRSGNPDPSRPSPDVNGEKRSQAAERSK